MSLSAIMQTVPRPVVHDDLARYLPELAARPEGAPFAWYVLSDAETQECYALARREMKEAGEAVDNGNALALSDALESRVAWHILLRAMRDPARPGDTAADPFPHQLARSLYELAAHLRPRARVDLLQRYIDIERDATPGTVRRLTTDEMRSVRAEATSESAVRMMDLGLLRSFALTASTESPPP